MTDMLRFKNTKKNKMSKRYFLRNQDSVGNRTQFNPRKTRGTPPYRLGWEEQDEQRENEVVLPHRLRSQTSKTKSQKTSKKPKKPRKKSKISPRLHRLIQRNLMKEIMSSSDQENLNLKLKTAEQPAKRELTTSTHVETPVRKSNKGKKFGEKELLSPATSQLLLCDTPRRLRHTKKPITNLIVLKPAKTLLYNDNATDQHQGQISAAKAKETSLMDVNPCSIMRSITNKQEFSKPEDIPAPSTDEVTNEILSTFSE